MGTSSINGPFSMAMLNNQRVQYTYMTIHIIPRKTYNLQHLTTSHSLTLAPARAHLRGLHPLSFAK